MKKLIALLPEDYEFGETGRSLGEQKALLASRQANLTATLKSHVSRYANMSQSEKGNLVDAIMLEGELTPLQTFSRDAQNQ